MKARPGFDFAGAFAARKALGDLDHVPAGMFARQALPSRGWCQALQDRLVRAAAVRATLAWVE